MVRTSCRLLLVSSALVMALVALSLGGGIRPASADMVVLIHEGTLFNGDANCDGWLNSLDALAVLQFDAGLLDMLVYPAGGDSNGDGESDSTDALLILHFDAGFMPDLYANACIMVDLGHEPPPPGRSFIGPPLNSHMAPDDDNREP